MRTDGLFDLQVNGYAGVDFNDESLTAHALDHALEAMRQAGVTGCLPTLISAHADQLIARIGALDAAVSGSRLGPDMVPGYHLEGPFLSALPGYSGCHPADAMIDPDMALFDKLCANLARPILLVTLAPERDGASGAIAGLIRRGITVAIGHSAANFSQVGAAVDAGLSLSTHLGNALPAMLPKLDNTLLAQLSQKRLKACLIADGHHVPADALRAIVTIKGKDNCILVTDAVLAASAPPDRYRFAGMDISLDETGRVSQSGLAYLAGSALELDQAVRNVIDWSIAEPVEAVTMAARHPRNAIAGSLRHHGIQIDPGTVEWNNALEPLVISP